MNKIGTDTIVKYSCASSVIKLRYNDMALKEMCIVLTGLKALNQRRFITLNVCCTRHNAEVFQVSQLYNLYY